VCLQMCCLNQHSPAVAMYWVDRSIAEAEQHGAPADLLRPLAVRGELLLAANRGQEALAVFQRVIAMPGGDEFVKDLASAQVLTGQSDEGIRTLTDALAEAERSKERDSAERIVSLAIRLADAKRALGDRQPALDVLRRAATRAESLTDATVFSTLMDRLGFALLEDGNAAAAIEPFERGIERLRRESPSDNGRIASLFSNLGNALAAVGNRIGSIYAFNEATRLARQAGDLRSQALSLFGMANVAATIDAGVDARDPYNEARAIAVQLGDQALEAACLDSLGQLQTQHGAPAQAVDLHIRASELHRAIGDYRGAHTDLMNLVQSYLLLGEIAAARRVLNEARSLTSHLDALPWQHALHEGQVLAREGRWNEARPAFDTAIAQLEKERETLRTPADQRRWAAQRVAGFEIAAVAAFEARDALAALAYLEGNRARFLDAVAEHRRRLPAAMLQADREAYIAASNRLSDLRWRRREHPDRQDADLDRDLAAATLAFDILDAEVERLRMDEHAATEAVASARELAERLSPGEAAVSLHVAGDWIGAACIGRRRDGTVWWDCDIDKGWFSLADLSRLVIGKAEGDRASAGPAWHDLATLEPSRAESLVVNTCETIRNVVWPLIERLVADQADALVLIPGRGLNVLPLHAAATSDNRLAIDRWSIRYAPSLNLLARAGKAGTLGSSRTLAQAVNPTGDLPFADLEASAVRRSWSAAPQLPLRGSDARTTRVLRLFDESDVLHFAGHGAFDHADPLQSHLLCATDGLGSEITLRMLLERGAAIRSRVVLLSACETGVVVAEDPVNDQLGLPGGLLVAGASAVLATLWRVDDLAASLILGRTVAIWEREAVDLERALAAAQAWLRTQATARVVREWIDEHLRDADGTGPEVIRARDSLARAGDDELLFSNALYWAPFHVTGRSVRLGER
jgi:CHAT domain-containing protein